MDTSRNAVAVCTLVCALIIVVIDANGSCYTAHCPNCKPSVLQPGESTTLFWAGSSRCRAEYGSASHGYVVEMRINAADGSKLNLTSASTSFPTDLVDNGCFYSFADLGKDRFSTDVNVTVTCRNQLSEGACHFQFSGQNDCYRPCCFQTNFITCSDGSLHTVTGFYYYTTRSGAIVNQYAYLEARGDSQIGVWVNECEETVARSNPLTGNATQTLGRISTIGSGCADPESCQARCANSYAISAGVNTVTFTRTSASPSSCVCPDQVATRTDTRRVTLGDNSVALYDPTVASHLTIDESASGRQCVSLYSLGFRANKFLHYTRYEKKRALRTECWQPSVCRFLCARQYETRILARDQVTLLPIETNPTPDCTCSEINATLVDESVAVATIADGSVYRIQLNGSELVVNVELGNTVCTRRYEEEDWGSIPSAPAPVRTRPDVSGVSRPNTEIFVVLIALATTSITAGVT